MASNDLPRFSYTASGTVALGLLVLSLYLLAVKKPQFAPGITLMAIGLATIALNGPNGGLVSLTGAILYIAATLWLIWTGIRSLTGPLHDLLLFRLKGFLIYLLVAVLLVLFLFVMFN